jgi:hypothetical protein
MGIASTLAMIAYDRHCLALGIRSDPRVDSAEAVVNTFPVLVAIIASGNAHAPSEIVGYTAMAIQWTAVGFVFFVVSLWFGTWRNRGSADTGEKR